MLKRCSGPTVLLAASLRRSGSVWTTIPKRAHRQSSSTAATKTPIRPLLVLGIESSADDSCCAIVTSSREILANVVVKQHTQNAKYGGIHPLRAQEAHLIGVPRAISTALENAQMRLDEVDAIAYTRGPGMFGCLGVGASAARALAAGSGKPLIGVHHMQAHALTPLLTEASPPAFPFLVLLVSGGHTQLVLARELDRFEILMDKLDNSIGGAFDRAARTLYLPSSSTRGPGAVLEDFASQPPLPPFDAVPMEKLPIPFQYLSKDEASRPLAFSFAGLLAALERAISPHILPLRDGGVTRLDEAVQREGARQFQRAAIGHLSLQVRRAIEHLPSEVRESLGGLVVSGGVASNAFLRTRLQHMLEERSPPVPLYYPPVELCTDNAAMIAWTAILRLQTGRVALQGESFDLPLRAKWSLEDLLIDEISRQ